MLALVATMAFVAAAFQIDPDVVTEVSTPSSGLWIPSPLTGEVLRVDAASGRVTARVPVGEPGADFIIDERENGVVVVDRTSGTVALVDPALHVVTRDVRTVASDLVDIGPETIAMGSGSTVALIDLDVTGSTSADVPGPLRSVAADGTGLIAENGSERVAVETTGEAGDAKESGGQVVRAVDEVVVLAANGVRGLDGNQRACFDSPVGRPTHVIGTAENWVVAIDESTIHVADLGNGECSSILLDVQVGALGRPVVAGRRVYVPETGAGVVHIFNPDTRAIRSHAVLDPGDLRLRARDEFVVAYDANTTVAALLDVNGFVRFIDTSPGGQGIQAVLTDGGSAAVVGGDGNTPGVAVDGVDGVSASNDAPVIDAGVLAATLRNPGEDDDPGDDELVANFAFSAATVGVGELTRFVDDSTGSPTSWLWDFGDGTGAEGPEVEKAWDVAGTYPVTLRVSRGEETAEISLAITVVPAEVPLPPAADFVFSSTVVALGDSIDFEDRSDGEIERWRWDFGDGTTSTARNVTKAWRSPGSYTVQLTVANGQGSDSAFIVIKVVEGLRGRQWR